MPVVHTRTCMHTHTHTHSHTHSHTHTHTCTHTHTHTLTHTHTPTHTHSITITHYWRSRLRPANWKWNSVRHDQTHPEAIFHPVHLPVSGPRCQGCYLRWQQPVLMRRTGRELSELPRNAA